MTAARVLDELETAATILQPHFDAVRDQFAEFSSDGINLCRAAKVQFLVDPAVHNKRRHFAATRSDGLLMMFAPQAIDLPLDTLVPILCHEFGHAVDFLYPAAWTWPVGAAGWSAWVGETPEARAKAWHVVFGGRATTNEAAAATRWTKAWERRTRDEIEWTADAIAASVTGKKLGYCGGCKLQCFHGGVPRPSGLR